MLTMEVTHYRDAYLQLRSDTLAYRSPTKDMDKYIDKLAMIGRKYRQLEKDIRENLSNGRPSMEQRDIYETEFSVLEYMIGLTMDRVEKNRVIREAAAAGDMELKALLGDLRLVRLTVKARAMGARAEMDEFTARIDRQNALTMKVS